MTLKPIAIATSLLVTLSLPAAAQVGAVPKGQAACGHKIVEKVDTDDMKRFLRQEGYEILKVDEDGDLVFKMEGVKVYMIKSNRGDAIIMRAAWSGTDATLAKVNTWNRSKRYSHAYIDDDGDPVMQLDLDLAGGVTEKRVADFILTTKLLLRVFQQEVL